MRDLQLWQNIKAGDKKALKELHDKYFNQMCLYAFKSTNGALVVEELVSDCFIKIWESRKKIDIKISVKRYIFFILRNSIIDYSRRSKFLTESIDNIQEPADEAYFDEQRQYAYLYSVMAMLPEQRRVILEMAVFESMTYQQIAEKLNISKNTVKTQMGRAYRFLKEKLDPKDFYLFCFFHRNSESFI